MERVKAISLRDADIDVKVIQRENDIIITDAAR